MGCTLLTHQKLRGVESLSIFISPLGRQELSFLKEQSGADVESLVTDVMRRKLLRRMQRQKALLSQKDLEEVERRAGSSFRELAMAHHFQHVIVNHDGEDSENWNAFYDRILRAPPSLMDVFEVFAHAFQSGCSHKPVAPLLSFAMRGRLRTDWT